MVCVCVHKQKKASATVIVYKFAFLSAPSKRVRTKKWRKMLFATNNGGSMQTFHTFDVASNQKVHAKSLEERMRLCIIALFHAKRVEMFVKSSI